MPEFIVFEGIDGAGKTTLTENLYHSLKNLGIPVQLFREPTQYDTGIRLREFLKGEKEISPSEEIDLFIQDRIESVKRNILPSLEEGSHVILDRYYYSTAAYQWKSGLTPEEILEENVSHGFPKPDKVVFLNIPVDTALGRIQSSRGIVERFETKKELEIILERYLRILPEDCIYVDATLPADELLESLIQELGL